MRTSYKQLIAEHDAIETAADALLTEVDKGFASSAALSAQLSALATVVEEHVEREDKIIAGLDENQLSGPWIAAWREGADAFEQLKSDWTIFLKAWNVAMIQDDRIGFTTDARAILGRLRDRGQLETQAFYATALQTGTIGLR